MGWPLIGETLQFIGAVGSKGTEGFLKEKAQKYGTEVFKISVLGRPLAVFCGAAGNKFLFSNENRVLVTTWPPSVARIFGSALNIATGDHAKRTRKLLMAFLKPEALQKFVSQMDLVAREHLRTHWNGKLEVRAYDMLKVYAFALACTLFASIEGEERRAELSALFKVFLRGLMGLDLKIPGTRHYKAKNAAAALKRELMKELEERRVALSEGRASPKQDLLSYLLTTADDQGGYMSDTEVVDNILLMLFAGHDTSSSTLLMVVKHLAEKPYFYNEILKEQREIAQSKKKEELLNWEDLRKMKYTWNVVCEVMRVSPSVSGTFRRSITDFNYAGFHIPKDWTLHWSVYTTHMMAEYFPEPEKFDPSRFDGAGPPPYTYVPFGGGPRMCPGLEFARVEILVLLHNLVRNYKWELIFPDEKIRMDPMPVAEKGLPIHVHPHQ
ncbi:cytochrome P450 716B1-like [Amborella trichopoda]|uniref:cytochrome P450 716B1-like n=1 Tax=Amborella trichopoda TaxID=13333 RepID=UPI0009C0E10A|nr:cytochrome P450 716B1-like [Amborella trichopoda]|eukprot:XP_020527729.1 cytochrome P450 716B1-like [Amborella trichopoda]